MALISPKDDLIAYKKAIVEAIVSWQAIVIYGVKSACIWSSYRFLSDQRKNVGMGSFMLHVKQ